MQRIPLEFSVKSSDYKAREIDSQVCKNWYGMVDEEGKFKMPMLPFPGSELIADGSSNKSVRGLYSLNNVLYAVVDDEFRIYSSSGGYIKKGTLNTSQGRVLFMANDNQVFISDAYNGYVYQLVDTISRKAGDFFVIENATSFIGTVTFVGSGINDLAADGTYIGSNDKTYKIEIDGQSESSIGIVTFHGTGLNDMTAGGTYTGLRNKTFRVQIDGTGTPDTFKWSDDDGGTWQQSTVDITVDAQELEEGITITFAATTGHTVDDYWSFNAIPAGENDTFKWSDDNGDTWLAEDISITGAAQLLNNGVTVTFQHLTGHATNDYWTFDVSTDSAFYAPFVPIYYSPYGIYPKRYSKIFYITSIEDFSAINALDYAGANTFPDNLVVGAVVSQEIIFLCRTTIEFWYNTANPQFPFQRRPNILINYGCLAPYTLAVGEGNKLFWLGRSQNGGKIVLMMQNYQPIVISDYALNGKLEEYSGLEEAFAFIIEWEGRTFYFLTIPQEDVTWVYDISLKRWYQRTTRYKPENLNTHEYKEGRYLANCHTYHDGMHLIGDCRSGNIYKLSKNYYKDGDESIICEAISKPIKTENSSIISVYSLTIDFENAPGLTVGQGSDPQAMLQYSKDGGFTWSKELWRSLGKKGEYRRRVRWNKLNYSRSGVYKIRISDPVYRVLLGAIIELEDTSQ